MNTSGNSRSETAPRIVALIITWNRVKEAVRCLESFAVVRYPNYEIVVVDDASQDTTVATIRLKFPNTKVITNEKNLGYAAASNVGFRYALEQQADHVFLLNQDTEMTPTVLSDLVEVITSDARIAIAGAKNLLMENPRYTWGKYGVINWGPMLVRTVGRFALDGPDVPMRDVDFVIGNGCLIRCSALRDVGLFDETFFQLHEDVDWSLRARRCGYRTVYVDRAAILHKGSSSSQAGQRFTFRAAYFVGRNAIVFARRHAGFAQWARLFPLMIFGAFMRAAIGSAYAVFSSVREQAAFVRGMIAGFKKAPPRWESEQRDSGVWAPGDSWLDRLVRWLGG